MNTIQALKSSLPAPSTRLDNLILAAKTVRDVSDFASFPYLRVAASLVLQILEIVQSARKNQDDLEELAETLVQIVVIIRDTLRANSRRSLPPPDFTKHCQEFVDKLLEMTTELNDLVRHTQTFTRFFKTGVVRDTILQYRRQVDNLRSNFTLATMMHMSLKIFGERRPRELGYTWEYSKPLRFIDAMNVTIHLPMDLCSTPTDFQDLLKFLFRKRRGRRFVENGHYMLTHGNQQSLEHGLWRSVVKPGITIRMDIILKSQQDLDTGTHQCPSCGDTCAEAAAERNEITCHCTSCEALFCISRATENPLTSRVVQVKPFATNTADLLLTPLLLEHDEETDIRYFRRFRVVLERPQQENLLQTLLMDMLWAYPAHEFDANYLDGSHNSGLEPYVLWNGPVGGTQMDFSDSLF